MPHLQQVFEKFEGRGFAVLAINCEPTQRKSVLPLLKAMGLTFVPVESDWAWAEQQYSVTGTPEAVLIDQQGRIMFKPSVHDTETRIGLERQVEALLSRAGREPLAKAIQDAAGFHLIKPTKLDRETTPAP